LETAANLLELLERILTIFSKCALKSLYNQTGFDSAIRRFDPSRPSQAVSQSTNPLRETCASTCPAWTPTILLRTDRNL
jgi:hypothetical protein